MNNHLKEKWELKQKGMVLASGGPTMPDKILKEAARAAFNLGQAITSCDDLYVLTETKKFSMPRMDFLSQEYFAGFDLRGKAQWYGVVE